MTRRGRPRAREGSVKMVQVKLRLYADADDDLLAFFTRTPLRLRAAMVKRALRSGISSASANPVSSEDELLDALSSLVS